MEKLDIKIGDIILVKDSSIVNLSGKLLLVLDSKGIELLCALIDKETNGIEITIDDLEEGKLRDKGIAMIEKLFTISPMEVGYFALTAFLGLGWVTWIFVTKRGEWHAG